MKFYIFQMIKRLPNYKYLFWSTLSFYIILLIINPPNKIIALSFVVLFLIYYLKIKKIKVSLFYTFISSLLIQTGKTYPIQMLPAGVFPIEIFPQGYFINLVITSMHFIAFVMLLYIIRQLFLKTHPLKLNIVDLLLVNFYFLRILSAILVSKEPGLSISFNILSMSGFVAYFFARFFIKLNSILLKNLSYILSALVIFEVILGLSQLAIKSPLYKNIEYQVNIEYFGNAIDETQFTFRPVGTYDHANTLGIWTASVCIFLFAINLKIKSNLIWLSFLTGCVLLITTISRSAWLGFFVAFLFTTIIATIKSKFLLKPFINFILKWRIVIVPFAILLFSFFVLPRAEKSLYSFGTEAGAVFFRQIQIFDAIEIIKIHPFLGVGSLMGVYEGISLNLYTVAASIPLAVHNWYLYVSVENGLFTVIVFIYFLILSLKKLLVNGKDLITSISISAFIICLLVAGLFQPYLNIEFILLFLSLTNGVNIIPRNVK